MLEAAIRDSRFYREHLHGVSPVTILLTSLPPVSRRELMDLFDDWVTDPQLKLNALRAFTVDPERIGQPYLGKYLVWESSGTSHQPGTVAALLADEAVRGALHFRPKEVWTGGETLSAAVRNRLVFTLGCAVRNSYGASEFVSIAWECEQGRLYVNADWVILEPVDQHGRPMPAGMTH